jgi:hypothetical protein
MMILLGIVQFGVLFRDYITLTDAVREGARKAAVARVRSGDRVAYVKQEVDESASDLDGFDEDNVEVTSTWEHGEDIVVTAHYPFSIDVLGWVVRSGDMTSTATERVE